MDDPYGNALHMTADVVLIASTYQTLRVLLIQRSDDSDAYPGCWALPGGYMDPGERIEETALRELREETGITTVGTPGFWRRIGIYDNPDRDPRGRVVSVAFAECLQDVPTPKAGDDAAGAQWLPLGWALQELSLAFDHRQIIIDAVAALWKKRDRCQLCLFSRGCSGRRVGRGRGTGQG